MLTSKSCFNFFNSSFSGSVVKAASTYHRKEKLSLTLVHKAKNDTLHAKIAKSVSKSNLPASAERDILSSLSVTP